MRLIFYVVDGGAVDARVVYAGEHEHLLIRLAAHYTWLLGFFLFEHYPIKL